MTAAGGSIGSRHPRSLIHLIAGLLALLVFLLGASLVVVLGRWRVRQRIDTLALRNQPSTWKWKAIARRLLGVSDMTGHQALLAIPLRCLATHCPLEPLLPRTPAALGRTVADAPHRGRGASARGVLHRPAGSGASP